MHHSVNRYQKAGQSIPSETNTPEKLEESILKIFNELHQELLEDVKQLKLKASQTAKSYRDITEVFQKVLQNVQERILQNLKSVAIQGVRVYTSTFNNLLSTVVYAIRSYCLPLDAEEYPSFKNIISEKHRNLIAHYLRKRKQLEDLLEQWEELTSNSALTDHPTDSSAITQLGEEVLEHLEFYQKALETTEAFYKEQRAQLETAQSELQIALAIKILKDAAQHDPSLVEKIQKEICQNPEKAVNNKANETLTPPSSPRNKTTGSDKSSSLLRQPRVFGKPNNVGSQYPSGLPRRPNR